MSVFHPGNPPEPRSNMDPSSRGSLVVQISLGKAPFPAYLHRHVSVFNPPPTCVLVCLPIPPPTLPCPEISSPGGWAVGGTAMSTWYGKHPHPHRPVPWPGPGPGLHVGSPGSACAQLLGSLAARAPTLRALAWRLPSLEGFVRCRNIDAGT